MASDVYLLIKDISEKQEMFSPRWIVDFVRILASIKGAERFSVP